MILFYNFSILDKTNKLIQIYDETDTVLELEPDEKLEDLLPLVVVLIALVTLVVFVLLVLFVVLVVLVVLLDVDYVVVEVVPVFVTGARNLLEVSKLIVKL
jgi:hypothetical protein